MATFMLHKLIKLLYETILEIPFLKEMEFLR